MGSIIEVESIRVPIGTHESKTIVIGSDHRGFRYKCLIIEELKLRSYTLIDVGTGSAQRCDYPPISDEIGRKLSENPNNQVGIGICGSGIGILISASKHNGVYVARCLTPQEAETSRKHNNTNMLGIGADYMSPEVALQTINAWLTTPFYSNPKNEAEYLKRFVQIVRLERLALERGD